MFRKFTDNYAKSLQPKEKRYEVREAGREGFAIRVSPGGAKSWLFIFDFQGQRQKLTLGRYCGDDGKVRMTLAQAHTAHDIASGNLATGVNPAREKRVNKQKAAELREKERGEKTLQELFDRYLEEHAKTEKRTWVKDESMYNCDVRKDWGGRKANSITRGDIIEILNIMKKRGVRIHANRMLALLRKVFNFGKENGVVESNPCAGLKKPFSERPRHRYLTETEVRRFWNGLDSIPMNEGIKRILKLTLLLGTRPGEVCGMLWQEIDGNLWIIPAERRKSKVPLAVPLPKLAQQLIGTTGEAGPVFPNRSIKNSSRSIHETSVANALRKYLPALCLVDVTPHDLRRTASTLWSRASVPRYLKPILLGHAPSDVTDKHYDLYEYLPEKQQALENWAAWVERTVGDGPTEEAKTATPVCFDGPPGDQNHS